MNESHERDVADSEVRGDEAVYSLVPMGSQEGDPNIMHDTLRGARVWVHASAIGCFYCFGRARK
jgi:hypothetical protein